MKKVSSLLIALGIIFGASSALAADPGELIKPTSDPGELIKPAKDPGDLIKPTQDPGDLI